MDRPLSIDTSSSRSTQPLITFTTHGRNDDYMGNAVWRMETSLNSLGYSLEKLGLLDQGEAMVCDWGSAVPLSQVLRLSAAAHRITRFVHVPPKLATDLQKDSPYPVVLSMNTAIRRARGTFVTMSDMDALYTPETVARLFGVATGEVPTGVMDVERAIFCGPRRHIPHPVVAHEPDGGSLQEFLRRFGRFLPSDRIDNHALAPAVVTIAHRDVWHGLRGYEETMLYNEAMDIDLIVRVTKRYPAVHLGREAGLTFFHLEHYSNPHQRHTIRKANRYVEPTSFAANDESWGLGDFDLDIQDPVQPPVTATPVRAIPRALAVRIVLAQNLRYLRIYAREDLMLLTQPWAHRWRKARSLLGGRSILEWPRVLNAALEQRRHGRALVEQAQPNFDWQGLRTNAQARRWRAGAVLAGLAATISLVALSLL